MRHRGKIGSHPSHHVAAATCDNTVYLALRGGKCKHYVLPLFRAMSQVDFKTSGDSKVSKEWLTLPHLWLLSSNTLQPFSTWFQASGCYYMPIADLAHPSRLEVQDSLQAVFSEIHTILWILTQSTFSGTLCFFVNKCDTVLSWQWIWYLHIGACLAHVVCDTGTFISTCSQGTRFNLNWLVSVFSSP